MTRPSIELADVIRRFGPRHELIYGGKLMPSQKKCLQDIVQCMTPALGGSRYHCEGCGESFWRYHGCGNRSCPKCLGPQTENWLEARRSEILPCHYFHLVVTIPCELRSIALRHQKILYGLLMKVSADCVRELALDKRHLGGEVGIMAVLHTWSGQLHHHPHVHMLVTGGGIEEGGLYWKDAPENFLIPVKALSKLIRGRFSRELEKTHPEIHEMVSSRVWGREWCSFCKPFGTGNEAVLNYLARYVFRVAISNSRILSMDETHVTIRYKNHDTGKFFKKHIPGEEFIRLFLLHVLPKGFHKVRYYGLWAPVNRTKMLQARLLLSRRALSANFSLNLYAEPQKSELLRVEPPEFASPLESAPCPKCGSKHTVIIEQLDPYWRKTPA